MEDGKTVATDNQIDETASADTLKPGAGSGGTESRAQTLATFTQLLSQLGKEDLSSLYTRTVAQIGHEADSLPAAANAAANKSSVAAKTVKEDIDEMFAGDELTEEFREKATVVFEAAVNTRSILETARLEEEFEAAKVVLEEQLVEALESQVDAIRTDLTEKLDQYLDHVVAQWLEENKLAIEGSLRTEIAENFIKALHNTFAEHYITVPEEQIDIVAEIQEENKALKAQLNTVLDEKLELETIVSTATKEAVFDEIAEGLVETQVEKLRSLAEGVDFDTTENFQRKLKIIKENLFKTTKSPSEAATAGLITEEAVALDEADAVVDQRDPMNAYTAAIKKSVK